MRDAKLREVIFDCDFEMAMKTIVISERFDVLPSALGQRRAAEESAEVSQWDWGLRVRLRGLRVEASRCGLAVELWRPVGPKEATAHAHVSGLDAGSGKRRLASGLGYTAAVWGG